MYLLFAGSTYYPKGGGKDLVGKFYTLDSAIAAYNPSHYDEDHWAHILCLKTMTVVWEADYSL